MFGLLARSRKPVSSVWRNRARLGVERLETRDCPAAPVITSFSVTALANKMVSLHGTLTDTNPASTFVTLGGKVTGQMQADSSGNFGATLAASALGTVTAVARDQMGLTSPTATATITQTPPQITMSLSYGTGHQVILNGTMTDQYPGGITVVFTGVASGSATPDGSGNYRTTLTATQLGNISGSARDCWGQVSNIVTVTASDSAPVVANLTASTSDSYTWTITGTVSGCDHPGGLTVVFSSTDIPSVNGKTAVVQADGTFSLSVVITPGQSGYIYAQTTSWWGLQSNVDWEMITTIVGGGNPTGGG